MELQILSHNPGLLGPAGEGDVSMRRLREPSLHLRALRENKGSALMQHRSAARFSIEQGSEMDWLLKPERRPLGTFFKA